MPSPSVGVLVLARDEQEALPRCLRSVEQAVDEMVVIDMASEDDTVAVARSFGAHVVPAPVMARFDAARQIGLDALGTDWVLQLDADEWAPELLRSVSDGGWWQGSAALRCPKLNYSRGRVYTRQGWWPNHQVRLFERRRARYSGTFHRFLHVEGPVRTLPAAARYAIHHLGAPTPEEMVRDATRYLPPAPVRLGTRSGLAALGRPLIRYGASRAWRDGSDGLAILAAHIINEVGRRTS